MINLHLLNNLIITYPVTMHLCSSSNSRSDSKFPLYHLFYTNVTHQAAFLAPLKFCTAGYSINFIFWLLRPKVCSSLVLSIPNKQVILNQHQRLCVQLLIFTDSKFAISSAYLASQHILTIHRRQYV